MWENNCPKYTIVVVGHRESASYEVAFSKPSVGHCGRDASGCSLLGDNSGRGNEQEGPNLIIAARFLAYRFPAIRCLNCYAYITVPTQHCARVSEKLENYFCWSHARAMLSDFQSPPEYSLRLRPESETKDFAALTGRAWSLGHIDILFRDTCYFFFLLSLSVSAARSCEIYHEVVTRTNLQAEGRSTLAS